MNAADERRLREWLDHGMTVERKRLSAEECVAALVAFVRPATAREKKLLRLVGLMLERVRELEENRCPPQ